MSNPVYLDNNATTQLNAQVLGAMLPFMQQQHGNATSRHRFGREARQAIDIARQQVAEAVGAHPTQVIFTSGGTEADNLAISGMHNEQDAVAYSAVEHPAVSRPALALLKQGIGAYPLSVDSNGMVSPALLDSALSKAPTGLVSIMLVNNETGVIQDIAALAQVAKKHGAWLHTDAVQALGKLPIDFMALGAHAMSLSSHKIHGPQGAGALIVDKRVDLRPLLYGGGQEKGLRSGSENIAAIVGFGAACALATHTLLDHTQHIARLHSQLEHGLKQLGAVIFAEQAPRVANTSFFAFEPIEGETLVTALDKRGFAVASGSACSSDSTEPSHVLLAMGVAPDLARGAVRVSLAHHNTAEEIHQFLLALQAEITRFKQMTAVKI